MCKQMSRGSAGEYQADERAYTVPQVQMAVEAKFVQDTLKGDGVTEIRMRFIRRIEDNLPAGEE